ncbi:zf-CCHC domain-containing protein [Cephalotus follicularis]|uniref:Zf-CCHC domain-containing protein n=1 Tax=Cephalotus follicularis TaxID=3775 RepID=A0A1Q3D6S4_CEPFO|nr:zf-CCHC domain-containing protein [Cephalotus follicularis]GAV87949.1 zf-CCHC domain-containing protein [Cephalotus follicularis]
MALLIKRIKKILMNKKNFSKKPFKKFPSNKGDSSKKDKEEKEIICYECDKPGHTRPECPKLKKNKDFFLKKKAMIATWSDSDESSSEEDIEEVANIALMAIKDESDHEETTSSLSFNELQCEYDELLDILNDLNREYSFLRKIARDREKENVELKNCILEMKKDERVVEKDSILEIEYEKLKELFFEKQKEEKIRIVKESSPEKENLELKLEIDALRKTFSKFSNSSEQLDRLLGVQRCVFDRAGLGYDEMNKVKHLEYLIDRKKNNKVVTCNFCGKNGHISTTCVHKRIGAKTKKIWVPKGIIPTNLKGPKAVWVPKKST